MTRVLDVAVAEPRDQAAPARLLFETSDNFATLWNRESFKFAHGLAHHPLFSLEGLREVAARTPKSHGFVHWQNGPIEVTDNWAVNTGKRLTLDETILGIAENNSLVLIKHAEQDPNVGPALQQVLTEIVDLVPSGMRDDVTIGESIIFISSPKRITTYHMDLEANCLLQVGGEKTVHVFDQDIVSTEEIEKQCCGDQNAAVFNPERQSGAHSYALKPGVGVHFPSLAPHWVQNDDNVSISININFELRSVHHRLRGVHRFNNRMRRFGLNPGPPGRNTVLDGAKAAVENGLIAARRTLRPRAVDVYPVWRPRKTTGPV